MHWVRCNTDGNCDGAEVLPFILDSEPLDLGSQLLCQTYRVLQRRLAVEHAELFAAVAAGDVFPTQVFTQELSERTQECVPSVMAVGIVEGLEVIYTQRNK